MKTIRSNVNKSKKTLALILFALAFFVCACCIFITHAYFSSTRTGTSPSIAFGKLLLSVDSETDLSTNRINLGILTGNSTDGFEFNNQGVLNGDTLSVIGSVGLETGSVDCYVRMRPEVNISNWANSITSLRQNQITQLFASRFMAQLLQLGDKNDSNAYKWFAPTNADGYYYYGNAMTVASPFKYGDYASHGSINLNQIITNDIREEMYGTSIALSLVYEAIQMGHVTTTSNAVIEDTISSGYSLANANIISSATYFVQDNFDNLVFLDSVSNLAITEKIVEFGDSDFTTSININSNQKTFTSSNTSVATINPTSGLVHIVGQGQTTISVSVTYGGETNTEDLTLTVVKRDLSLHKASASFGSIDDEIYTGSAITPDIASFDIMEPIGNITLVKNQDYTLSYRDNINVGKASIIITGIGNYSGTIELNFRIRVTYYVAFNSNGGTGTAMANQAFEYGETIDLTANTYTKSGYNFIGWNTSSDGTGVAYADEASVSDLTLVNGEVVTLYAQWLGGLYTITLQSDTGSDSIYLWYGNGIYKDSSKTMPMTASTYAADIPDAVSIVVTYDYNGGTGVPASSLANGSTFSGYYDETSNLEMINANGYVTNNFTNTTYSSNKTLVAEWSGNPSVTLPNPTLTGYTFGGWYEDDNTFNTKAGDGGNIYFVATSITLHAKWTPITYTIIFDSNGGSGTQMQNQSFTYDVAQNLSSNSYTRTGYTFDSWNTLATGLGSSYSNAQSVSNLTVTSNDEVTLYAIWTPITYTIVFNANGGMNTMQPQVLTYDIPATLTPNAFTHATDTFICWNRSQDGLGQSYTDEEEVLNLSAVQDAQITLYAIWGSAFTITLNSGSPIANGTTTTGTTTIYESYGQGFYLNQDLTNEVTKSNASTTNSIVLPHKYYTVTYNVNDGQYIQPDISEMEFLGYYTLENGGTQIIDANGYVNTSVDYSFNENTTLFAHWGSFEALTLPTAVRGGYVFKGWFTSQDFTSQVNSTYTPTADVTIYAKWKETFITFSSSSSFTIESLVGKSWGSHDWGATSAANDPTNKDAGDGTIEYSTDGGATWTTWEKVDNQYVMSSGSGNVLYVRGSGNQVITGYNKKDSSNKNLGWRLTGTNISCYGNIENLLDWETVAAGNHPVVDDMALRNLFANNPNLVSAPELPLMTLTKECYASMFNGCTGLTNLPALPATTLGNSCYSWMYENCTNILIVASGAATPYTVVDTHNYASYSSATNPCSEMFKGTVILNNTLMNSNGTPKLSANNDCILEIAFIISTITLENNGATSGVNAIYETNKESDGNGGYTDVNIKRYVNSSDVLTVITNTIPAPEKSYTITYNYNGATGGNSKVSDSYAYTFLGYYTAQNGGGTQVIEANGACKQAFMDERYLVNTTMYANWQAPNSLITLPTPTRTGYNFAGWYYDSALQNKAADGGALFAPNNVMDLYAKWSPISYTIRFEGNNTHVVGNVYTQQFYYNVPQTLTPNQFIFGGHTFTMWTLNSSYEIGDEYYEDEQEITSSLTTTDGDIITFYAQWFGGSNYVVTLNDNGATTAGTDKLYIDMDDNSLFLDMAHNTELDVGDSIVAPQKSYNVTLDLQGGTAIDGNGDEIDNFNNVQTINCLFAGYFNGSNEQMINNLGEVTNKLDADRLNISDNVTFNAVWGNAPITLPNLEKANHLFKGWYANSTYTLKVGDAGDSYLPTGATTLYAKWRENYTQFTSDTSFTLSKQGGKKWDGTLYYSTSLAGEDWTSNVWNGTGSVASAYDSSISKYVLYLKGVGNTYLSGFDYAANGNSWNSANFQWSISSATNLILSGNFESMLDYNVVAGATSYTVGGNTYTVAGGDYELGHPIVGKGCAQYLFRQINIKEVSQDFLTSTIMGVDCYRDMFRACTSLTIAPALPALTLASGCYGAMFRDCNKLTTPPLLPATTLVEECYRQMFDSCSALQSIMTLTATTLVGNSADNGCYASMFNAGLSLYSSNAGTYNAFRIPYSGTGTINNVTVTNKMFKGVTQPTINTTYYVAVDIKNTVTFDKDGGTGGSDYVGAINGNAMPVAEAPTKAGYIFDGYWSKSGGNFVKQYYDENMTSENDWDNVTNETLYAKWIAKEYVVMYHINDGSTELVKYQAGLNSNSTIPTNVFTRDGYTFAGWSLTSNGTALAGTPTIGDTNPTASVVDLYAKWTANP